MDPELQKKYFELRKQLSSLNYSTNFGLDAIDVVQQLFGDLISTTESYTLLQDKENELSQDLSLAQAQLFPLKKENAKLSRENQQLHMDTVKLREELTDHQDTLIQKIKELEDKLKEVTFLCHSKDDALSKGEQQRMKLREAYEQLASTSLLSGGIRVKRSVKMSEPLTASGTDNPSKSLFTELGFNETKSQSPEKGKKDNKDFSATSQRNQATRLAIKRSQDQTTAGAVANSSSIKDIDIQAIVEKAREKDVQVLSSLQKQVEVLQRNLAEASESNSRLEEQLRRREDEWVKLSRQIGAVDSDSLGSDLHSRSKMQNLITADASNQRIIEQLNGQVDFLNEHLALREAQLVECSKELQGLRELQSECDYRGVLLNQAKENNTRLSGQMRVLENRIDELQRVTNPETPISKMRTTSSTNTSSSGSSSGSGSKGGRNHQEDDKVLRSLALEKDNLTDELGNLSNALQSLEAEDVVMKGRLARTEMARVSLRDELSAAHSQLELMKTRLKESQDVLAKVESENEELSLRLSKAQTALQQEAEISDENKGRVLELESRLSISETAKSRLEAALSEIKEDMSGQRRALSSTTLARDDADFQIKRLFQEKENALGVIERTQKELSITQDKMLVLDAKQMELTETNDLLNNQISLLNSQVSTLKVDLTSKTNDFQELLGKYMKVDQTNREMEFNIVQLRDQLSQLGVSKQTSQSLSLERDNLISKYNALLTSSDSLGQQVSMLKSQLNIAVEERTTLYSELEEKTVQCNALQSQLEEALFETKRLGDVISQRAQSSMSAEGHQGLLSDKVNTLTIQNSELHAELRLVNRRLFDAESKISQGEAALLDVQHSYSRSTSSLAKTEQSYSELQEKYESVKNLLRQREEEVSNLMSREERQHRHELDGRRDMRLLIEEKEKALKDVRDLKLLIKNMESDEKDMNTRVKRFDGKIFDLQQDVDRVSRERDDLKEQLHKKEVLVTELQESLRVLDGERDELQNHLDEIAEEDVFKQNILSDTQLKMNDLGQLLVQRDKLIEALRHDKEQSRVQLENISDRFRAMSEEGAELRRRLSLKQSQVGAASDDLMLMTRENQSVTTELASISHERDRLKQKINQYVEQVNTLEHSVRSLEIERGDLLETYRTCLQEKRKYEVDLNVMSESKARMSHTINELRGDIADATAELTSRRNSESRQMSERSALLLQIESLNDQLVSVSRKVQDREADLERLVRDKDGLQQTVLTLQQRSQTLVNRAASAGDTSKVLQARVTALERERDALRVMVDSERKRAADMAQLISASRSRDALMPESSQSRRHQAAPGTIANQQHRHQESSPSSFLTSSTGDTGAGFGSSTGSRKDISSLSNEEK